MAAPTIPGLSPLLWTDGPGFRVGPQIAPIRDVLNSSQVTGGGCAPRKEITKDGRHVGLDFLRPSHRQTICALAGKRQAELR